MKRIVSIVGSPGSYSRTSILTRYLEEKLVKGFIDIDTIYVKDLPVEDLLHANFKSRAIMECNKKIAEADGIIVASPVYQSSFTGILKSYLDLLPKDSFTNKTVLPIMTGGTIAHLLVIEYALVPVFRSLGAQNIIKGVYSLDTQLRWIDRNQFKLEKEICLRLDQACVDLLEEIYKNEAHVRQS